MLIHYSGDASFDSNVLFMRPPCQATCSKCGEGGALICCDYCPASFHMEPCLELSKVRTQSLVPFQRHRLFLLEDQFGGSFDWAWVHPI